MQEERYQRLRHWWEAFQDVHGSSDEEGLRRKLHLLEAEIRKTLREDGISRTGRRAGAILGFGATLAVLLLVLSSLWLLSPPEPDRGDTGGVLQARLGEFLPPAKDATVLPQPAPVAEGDSGSARSSPATRERRAPSRVAPPQRSPSPPPSTAQVPHSTPPPPALDGASVEEMAHQPPAVTDQERQLDPLVLLVALESELEK